MIVSRSCRPAIVALLLAIGLVLAGCGSGDSSTDHSATGQHSASSTTNPRPPIPSNSDFNRADVTFVQQMIPHHAQAVEMARLVPSRGAAPAVEALAANIEAAQQPEIDQMIQMLSAWNQPVPDTSMKMDHQMDGMTMSGMVDSAGMDHLRNARGGDFDNLFLKLMIEHHSGAIQMAKQEIESGKNPAGRALAQRIIDSQQAEITQMGQLLTAG